MIYYTSFSKIKKYPNMEFLAISENMPKGLEMPVIIELVPCSTLKYCDQKDFRRNYFAQLKSINRLELGNLLQDKCIVGDRPLNIFSHGQIVVEWLQTVGFEIKELE